jgi:hypothetical protein
MSQHHPPNNPSGSSQDLRSADVSGQDNAPFADPKCRAFPIATFCNRYGIGRSKAYEEINAGRLIAVKSGHRTLIREEDAERWVWSLPMIQSIRDADSSVVARDVLPKVTRRNAARNVTPRGVYRKK